MISFSVLSSSQHNDKVNFVALLDRFRKFIRVSGGMVHINLDVVVQFVFLDKKRLLHPGELLDKMAQAVSDGVPLDFDDFQAVRILAMRRMNMDFYCHLSLLPGQRGIPAFVATVRLKIGLSDEL